MVDDQDRCEWVNVSSGISSPGQSCKTVVVVLLPTEKTLVKEERK